MLTNEQKETNIYGLHRITGYWVKVKDGVPVKDVAQWLAACEDHESGTYKEFKVSTKRPRYKD